MSEQFAVTLPAVATRNQVKNIIAQMRDEAIATLSLSSASPSAARRGFVLACHSIALQRAVFGSQATYDAIRKTAEGLPEFKKSKAGMIQGKLGKLLAAYGEALAVGKVAAGQLDQASDEVNLTVLNDSPTFAALIAPPAAKVKAETKPETKDKAPEQAGEQEAQQQAQQAAAAEQTYPAIIRRTFAQYDEMHHDEALALLRELADAHGFRLMAKPQKKTA